MTSIVTLDERKARALSARKAALAQLEARLASAAVQYGGRYRLFGSAAIRAAEDACEEPGLPCDIIDRSRCRTDFLQRVLPGAKVIA